MRYDTYAEAIAAATDGDTVYLHALKDSHDQVTYDFSSDKNLTFDLCGVTLKQTKTDDNMQLVNNGTGKVTLTNGTAQRPVHNFVIDFYHDIDVVGAGNGGKIVFGANFNATAKNDDLNITSKNIALEVAKGTYQAEFKAGTGGSVSITGGQFWENDDPSKWVPSSGYVVRTDGGGGYKYVVLAHDHKPTYAAEGGVITVTCTEANNDVCKFGSGTLTLTAKNRCKNGKPYDLAAVAYAGNFPEDAKVGTHAIVYFSGETALGSAPSEPGKYVAKVTVGGATAAVEFEIYKIGLFIVFSSVIP